MNKKTLLSIGVTIAIFILLISSLDPAELWQLFLTINPLYFGVSMLFFIPIVLANALRWKLLVRGDCRIGLAKSVKLTMMAMTFSSVMPSRLGDLTKPHYLKKENLLSLKKGISAVVLEKSLDLFSISLLLVIGMLMIGRLTALSSVFTALAIVFMALFLSFIVLFGRLRSLKRFAGFLLRRERTGAMIRDSYGFLEDLRRNRGRLAWIFLVSLLLWFLTLMQIYVFFLCFSYFPPLELIMGLVPIAILVGMIPITIAGMGTRESAMIALFLEYAPLVPSTLVLGAGLLTSLRYWILAIGGLPYARQYINRL